MTNSNVTLVCLGILIHESPHDKTNKMTEHPAKTRINLGIRPVWSESSLCAQWVAKYPSFLHADSEDWSDWTDAQADLSLCWAHTHFVGFVMRRLTCNWGPHIEFSAYFSFVWVNFTYDKSSVWYGQQQNRYQCIFLFKNIYWCIFWRTFAQKNWAATRQNQQSECARSEDTDQPGHLPSLIRVFAVHSVGS